MQIGHDGQSLLWATVSGLGIAYLHSFLYSDALKQGQVIDVMPHLPRESQGIYLVYPPSRFTLPKVRTFIDFFLQKPLSIKVLISSDQGILPSTNSTRRLSSRPVFELLLVIGAK